MTDQIECAVDDLRLGRALRYAIHDTSGVLLLAAGCTITAETPRHLRARGIDSVLMHAADARGGHPELPDRAVKLAFDDPDELLNASDHRVRNIGPPARDSVVRHGRRAYNHRIHKQLVEQRRQSCDTIEQIHDDVVANEDVDGMSVMQVSTNCMESLLADIHDCVSVAFEAAGDMTVAEESVRTAVLGMAVGVELGFDASNVQALGSAGCLANVGQTTATAEIRNARRSLTLSERLELQKVPGRSLDILEDFANTLNIVRVVVYQMHERPDGSGYPRRLSGERIHPFARILRVADDYQASLIGRQQSADESPYGAMESLVRLAQERRVDPVVVRGHLHLLSLFPIGSFVRLSDGSDAKVLRSNGPEYTKPIVTRIQDADGATTDEDDDQNLIDLSQSDLSVIQAVPNPSE